MNTTDPSTDPDLIRADGEGMIDRREHEHHPVNTDPPNSRAALDRLPRDQLEQEYADLYRMPPDRDGEPPARLERLRVLRATILRRDGLASQDEADSGVEEDTRFNPNALGETEQQHMALARSCSDARLEEHLAEHGLANLPISQLLHLGARCLIAARRKGGSR